MKRPSHATRSHTLPLRSSGGEGNNSKESEFVPDLATLSPRSEAKQWERGWG